MKIRANRRPDNRPGHFSTVSLTILVVACLLTVARANQPPENAGALADRGALLIQACEYEAAEVILSRALELQPDLWNAQFNLARIPLLKRDWAEARHRFTAMQPADGESAQLIQYEILLTHLLAGENAAATEIVQQLEQSPEGEAIRYARAALAWQQDGPKEAANLTATARQNAAGPLAPLYAESFFDVGWERRPTREAQLLPNESALLSSSDQP